MNFSEIIQSTMATGARAFSIQLAKDTGVFDVLRNADEPLTSQQVADAKNLKERYARELLGFLTSSSLVQLSTNEKGEYTYHLKPEDKEALNKGLLETVGFIGALAEAYEPVRECVSKDGPHASRYLKECYKFLDERLVVGGDEMISFLFDKVPGLQERLEKGIKVLEFGSGTGRLLSDLASRFPNSSFTATEWKDELVSKLKVKWGDIPNMHFEIFDVMTSSDKDLPSTKYDWVLTVDVIHDLPHPQVAMENVRKILEPEAGVFVAFDKAGPGSFEDGVGSDWAALHHTLAMFFCIPESFQSDDSEAHGACWSLDTATSKIEQAGLDYEIFTPKETDPIFVCRCKK